MIIEDYVSFETAKLLKEKGFDGQCLSKYNSNGCIWDNIRYDGMLLGNNDIFPQEYLAPTLQMAMKWLREVHNIHINLNVGWLYFANALGWIYTIAKILENGVDYVCSKGDENDKTFYSSYEQACEVAIKYCLENLI